MFSPYHPDLDFCIFSSAHCSKPPFSASDMPALFLNLSETARAYQMQRMAAYYNALTKKCKNPDQDDKD